MAVKVIVLLEKYKLIYAFYAFCKFLYHTHNIIFQPKTMLRGKKLFMWFSITYHGMKAYGGVEV
jgi:hypothetical protein